MGLFDCHVHTNHSLDARYPMEQQLAAAQAAGLDGIAITDHADIDFYEPHRVRPRMEADVAEMREKRAAWAGRVELILGVEIGQALYGPQLAQGIIDRGGYDFIIGAVHSVRGVGGFYAMDMKQTGPEQVHDFLAAYFRDVEETVRTTDFDTLAHLTYPLRYIRQAVAFPVDYIPFEREIRRIMAILAGEGRAYELNLKPYQPDDGAWAGEEGWLLALFREAGGEHVTLGTDAHTPDKVGYGLEAGMKLLKEKGFTQYTVYRQRRPCPVDLEV